MKLKLFIASLFALWFAIAPLCASAADAATVGHQWVPLYKMVNPDLQKGLENALGNDPQIKRLIGRKKIAIALVDLGGVEPRFARINGNEMMYAASLPKIAILLGAYASLADGSLADSPELHDDLGRMIRYSDNAAATRVIDRIGMKKIQTVLKDKRYGLYDENRGGGLWVGKRYAKAGPRSGDPLHGISHGATATQVARFYYLLAEGKLVDPESSQRMLDDLADPRLNHKFVGAARRLAPKAKLYRKSGTWKQWHSDSIMVRGPDWRNYIAVAMVESPDGEAIIARVLPMVEKVLQATPQQLTSVTE